MKLLKLNKKETAAINEIYGDICTPEEIKDIITEDRRTKTFLNELKKIEKANGYEPHGATLLNMFLYFGDNGCEIIEAYVSYYKDDLKTAAERYFNTYY